ncbi:hypothetical protein EYV94_26360 [Puteibacter caeruleilacunae]|nr:hypothetical protein EYV94_26360 [Puteibacter caeruleilacunae]
MIRKILLICCLVTVKGYSKRLCAQSRCDSLEQNWIPKVNGCAPKRGLEVSYKSSLDYNVHSKSDLIGPSQDKIVQNRLFKLKLKVPMINRPNFKMIGGFHYSDEQFYFKNRLTNDYPLYQGLDKKNLKSIGGTLYFMHRLKERSFFMLRLGASLKGDYWKEGIGDVAPGTFLKYEITPLIGWKVNPYKSWGLGVAYSYSFGDPLVFPVIAYNHSFNKKWGIEAFLPAKVKIRHKFNDLSFLSFTTKISGGSYSVHLDAPELADFKTLELRRSELDFFFNLERGITDWLWVDLTAGYRANLRFDVTNKKHDFTLSGQKIFNKDYLIDSFADSGPFVKVSLFISPSKKLLKKLGF